MYACVRACVWWAMTDKRRQMWSGHFQRCCFFRSSSIKCTHSHCHLHLIHAQSAYILQNTYKIIHPYLVVISLAQNVQTHIEHMRAVKSMCKNECRKQTKEKCQSFILLTKLFIWAHLVRAMHKFYVTFQYREKVSESAKGRVERKWSNPHRMTVLLKRKWMNEKNSNNVCLAAFISNFLSHAVRASICVFSKGVEKVFIRMAANYNLHSCRKKRKSHSTNSEPLLNPYVFLSFSLCLPSLLKIQVICTLLSTWFANSVNHLIGLPCII